MANAIPIPADDPADQDPADATPDAADPDTADADPADAEPGDATITVTEPAADDASDAPSSDADTTESDATDPVRVIDEPTTADAPAADDAESTEPATETPAAPDTPAAPVDTPAPAEPTQPLTATDDALGTGGGVDDAECAIDRLVIYAGARRSGVGGSIRTALAQAGFGAGCPTPVAVLASNCPLQFAGVLGAGSGYDPMKSYVASSASVDRETMTAVMGEVGYAGNAIDILDFGFVNPDQPGETWMAIFVPPSFAGWETLASRAGLGATTASLCAPSGELAG